MYDIELGAWGKGGGVINASQNTDRIADYVKTAMSQLILKRILTVAMYHKPGHYLYWGKKTHCGQIPLSFSYDTT